MRVLITGAAGMLGTRLAWSLRNRGLAAGTVEELILADRFEPSAAARDRVFVGDVADADFVDLLASTEPDVVFHLAAIVPGETEPDVESGYDVNVHGLWHLLESARLAPAWTPRLVVASSVAVFADAGGAPIPAGHRRAPRSTFGTQKAIAELLVADSSRRGAVDGVCLRLPTIVVQPTEPNAAPTAFLSALVRAGLAGESAIIPVSRELRAWIASPDAAVGQLLHAASLPGAALADERCITMPGLSASVQDLVDAVIRHAGPGAADRLVERREATIEAIVSSWPAALDTSVAERLGFVADRDVDTIISLHLEWIGSVGDSEVADPDDVTGMEFRRPEGTAPGPRSGASEPMNSEDDAAASLLTKVRDFIDTLSDEERQFFAALLAPAVTRAWEEDEVVGFDAWSPHGVHDHLNRALRDEGIVISWAEPDRPA